MYDPFKADVFAFGNHSKWQLRLQHDIRVVAGFLMFECLTLERSLSTLYFVHSLLNSLL